MNEDWQQTSINKQAYTPDGMWELSRYFAYQAIMHPAPWRVMRMAFKVGNGM